ncbi:phosphatase PAP2 family protein [Haloarchaeobius sp. TZWWS8]|uniref:phosphatase PAP2 family protein n=1 Tax=Haloarchaeobius sp. TZWWS8 TaxID=3446121 RepID=UPI003EB7E0C1
MVRLEAASAIVRGWFPPEFVEVYAGVTTLGDPAVATLLLAVCYWVWRREETAAVVSYAFVAFAVTLLLKHGFALPRPPTGAQLVAEDGFGFPSGHTIGATVVYGGLALEYGWLRDRVKAALVALLVVSVGMTRVVLGVHYLGDVLVGFVVGAAVLWAGHTYWRDRPTAGFVVAGLLALPAILVSGGHLDAVRVVGYGVGGVVGYRALDSTAAGGDGVERLALVGAGLAFVLGMFVLQGIAEESLLAVLLVEGLLVAGVLSLPELVARTGVASGERADAQGR